METQTTDQSDSSAQLFDPKFTLHTYDNYNGYSIYGSGDLGCVAEKWENGATEYRVGLLKQIGAFIVKACNEHAALKEELARITSDRNGVMAANENHRAAVNDIRMQRDALLSANARLCGALHDAATYVENLAGRDNSCDPGCNEELTEWRNLIAASAIENGPREN